MPLFSILCTAPGDMPARWASWASDQPRSARSAATFAPRPETLRSISGSDAGRHVGVALGGFGWLTRSIVSAARAAQRHRGARGHEVVEDEHLDDRQRLGAVQLACRS